jgi:hypothetical protein
MIDVPSSDSQINAKIDAKIITKFWQDGAPDNPSGWFSIDLQDCKHSVVLEPDQLRVHVAQGAGFGRVRDRSWEFRSILRFETLFSTISPLQQENGAELHQSPSGTAKQLTFLRPVTVVMITHTDLLGDAGQIRIVDLGTTASPTLLQLLNQDVANSGDSISLRCQGLANEAVHWVEKANSFLKDWQRTAVPGLKIRSDRFSHRVMTEMLSQNDDVPDLGEGIGNMFAPNIMGFGASLQEFESGWWDVASLEAIVREPKRLCYLLHSLRGYVRSTALNVWLTTPPDKLDLDRYLGRGNDSLLGTARLLQSAMTTHRKPQLYFGYSQFHEDRLFSSLANLVIDSVSEGTTRLIPHVLDWKLKSHVGPSEPDFRLLNGFTSHLSLNYGQRPIFRHNGYNMYVRSDYLRQLLDRGNRDEIPAPVLTCLKRLLDGNRANDRTSDLAERCWILCEARVPWISGTEFDKIMPAIRRTAASVSDEVSDVPSIDAAHASLGFDDLFQGFVLREYDAFAGGSLHDRIIDRWLLGIDPPIIIKLLDHEDMKQMAIEFDPYNYVWPCGPLETYFANRQSDLTDLVRRLDDFLIKIGATLTAIADDMADPSVRVAKELSSFLSAQLALVPNDPHCIRKWRWSFISHPDDFAPLVRQDMTCPVHPNAVGQPMVITR